MFKALPVYGDGRNIRDWLYVEDHNAAAWTVMQKGRLGQTYNIGGENEWENIKLLDRLIEIVASEAGRNVADLRALITYVKDRPGHDRRYAIDCSKLKSELDGSQLHQTLSTSNTYWKPDPRELESGFFDGPYW